MKSTLPSIHPEDNALYCVWLRKEIGSHTTHKMLRNYGIPLKLYTEAVLKQAGLDWLHLPAQYRPIAKRLG